ncbi:MAG: RNA pseudouridine synthase, partial [Endozoicomonas sp.]
MGEVVKTIQESIKVPDELGGKRFDQIAASCFSGFSRARLQAWIRDGFLLVDGEVRKTKDKLYGGELLTLFVEIENEGQ